MIIYECDDEHDEIISYAVQRFNRLGFTMNLSKSVLPPTKTKIIERLGFVFNSTGITVQMTDEKKHCIIKLADNLLNIVNMMPSSNGKIFRVTGHLCGEFTGPRWIPHTKASDAELWCFLYRSAPEQTLE